MTKEETRKLAIEFERRIQQIYPQFNIKEKLTSDVIYSMLNEFQNVYFKQMVLADDQDKSGTRQQRMIDDSIAKFIETAYIDGPAVGDTFQFNKIVDSIITPTVSTSIPIQATNVQAGDVDYYEATGLFYVNVSYDLDSAGHVGIYRIARGRCVDSLGLPIMNSPAVDAKYPQDSKPASPNIYVCEDDNKTYTVDENGKLIETSVAEDEPMDKHITVFDVPTDYYAYIRSSSVLSKSYKQESAYTKGNYPMVPNIQVKPGEVVATFDTIYNSGGIIKNPLLVQHGSEFHLVCDKYTEIAGLSLQYYRNPNTFDLETPCEFPMRCFNDLVQGAVEMYTSNYKFKLAGLGSNRQQRQEKQGQEDAE